MAMSPQAQAIENKRVAQRINQKGLGAYADQLAEQQSKSNKKIEAQQRTINQLRQDFEKLRQEFILLKFSLTGSGPTV